MAWLAVDLDGEELIFEQEPIREENSYWIMNGTFGWFELPQGSIEKLTGKKITWNDEPIQI